MKRSDIINRLIKKYTYNTYLEIGVRRKENFKKIKCDEKTCVDPNFSSTFKINSTEFFKINKNRFDIIFIDGSHQEKDVDIDINESLKILNDNGAIVLHDCNPKSKWHQRDTPDGKTWNGTVWKSFVKLRFNNENLKMYTVNTDHGCGVITKGKQEKLNSNDYKNYLNYDVFDKSRKIFLNLISPQQFLKIVK